MKEKKILANYKMKKLLIANRGEIAVRIIRACKDMNIKTVAIYSTADRNAMHVKMADEAYCIGPASSSDSYLNITAIITVAIISGADSVHPGYGFLSENTKFVEMLEDHNIQFVGPKSEHIRIMGDKIKAKETAISLGLPTAPGSKGSVDTVDEAIKIANNFGYPIIIKAASGGGGRGMKIVFSDDEIQEAYNVAKTEAKASFGDETVYIEKYLQNPRHIEVQILGDMHGNVLHLFERDCSIQRRNQKVIEEALSPALTPKERNYICNLSAKAMKKLGYYSAGTIEYLYEDGKFYFMEMNTRLQVEHPVTEAITGIDLVYEMLRIAQGKPLKQAQEDILNIGHAIECRINAEHPFTFIPSPGTINFFHPCSGPGVRTDSALYTTYTIPPYYDSMVLKLIVHGQSRKHCINRLKSNLKELVIEGIITNIPLHLAILEEEDFITGNYTIKWLENSILPKYNKEV